MEVIVQEPESHKKWFMFAEQAVSTIYTLSEQPDLFADKIIKIMATDIFKASSKSSINSKMLSRFFFIIGHVAIKQVVHIEEIKEAIRKAQLEQKQNPKNKKKDDLENIEKELGSEQAEAESEADKMQDKAEQEIVSESNLIGRFGNLVMSVCMNEGGAYNDESLQSCAVLALCKFMCVHSTFCEKNLQLLFTILESSTSEQIRSNIVICLGDLAVRFPNLIEPWTSKIYGRLKDEDVKARNNTLMVLTHLILNDMIKVKGQIADMTICLEDSDPRIVYNAKLFFNTLSGKGNTLYNILPEIISRLTSDNINVKNDSIRNILKYLFGFISKAVQIENLVEKLCTRFKDTKNKALKKLSDMFKVYQDKLHDPEIRDLMGSIITKSKKGGNFTAGKTEMKNLLEELEKKMAIKNDSDDDYEPKANKQKRGNKKKADDDEEDEEMMDVEDEDQEEVVTPKPRSKRSAPPPRGRKVVVSDEEDDDDDDEEEEEEEVKKKPAKPLSRSAKKAAPPPPPKKKPAAKKAAAAATTKKKPAPKRKAISESESESEISSQGSSESESESDSSE
eukprot:gene14873-17588_t